MKKNIIFILACLLIAINSNAQVDRSKIPASGPTPVINLGKPHSFILSNGMTVLVVENKKLPKISVSLSIDTPPHVEGDKTGISSLTSSLMGKGTQNMDKNTFNEEVDFLGATVNVGTYGGYAQCLSKYTDKVFSLFADAALHPKFTEEELSTEKKRTLENIKAGENSAVEVMNRVRNALVYGKKHPAGEFITKETINNISLQDINKYYRDYFVPTNAYMVISGDISADQAEKLTEKYFGPWKSAKAPSFGISDISDPIYRQINFVDMPNAVQAEIAVVNSATIKMSDTDHHAALVTNYILGGSFSGYLNLNLREKNGYTYGSYSSLPRNKNYKSVFRAFAKVRNNVADSAVVEILNEIKRIRTEDVSDEVLKNAKASFLGKFILSSEDEKTIANRSVQIKTEKLPTDFYETFINKINAVTKEDVKRIANTYFNLDKARILIVGKGSEIVPALEKTTFEGKKIPIHFFDKYATRVEKPDYNSEVPKGVTAQSILDNYFKAIGGKEKLASVKSTFITATADFNGAVLGLSAKSTSKNQSLIAVSFNDQIAQKIVFDGEKGYTMAQGQKIVFDDNQTAQAKKDSYPFPELHQTEVSLLKQEPYANGKAYAVKISDKKTAYFDTVSGLKVKEVTVQEQAGQKMSVTIEYGDYKDVNGIKFPFTISQSLGPQKMDFIVKEVKVNESVSPEDFK